MSSGKRDEIADFGARLESEISEKLERSFLLAVPTPEQKAKAIAAARRLIEKGEFADPEEVLAKACPECFHKQAILNPDEFEAALGYLDGFDFKSTEYLWLDLSEKSPLGIDDVLHTPSADQITAVLKSNKGIGSSDNEIADNRKLAKALARRFPELVKNTPKATTFFAAKAPKSPTNELVRIPTPKSTGKPTKGKGGCRDTINLIVGLIVIAVILYFLFR
jgi:hypothetical protein